MKIMFSIQFGDSVAHVLRTRSLAQWLKKQDHSIRYVVSNRAAPYLKGFLDSEDIVDNRQSYGYSRLEPMQVLCQKFCDRVVFEDKIFRTFRPDVVIGDMGLVPTAYCEDVPLMKIVNRFFVDFGRETDSVFTTTQRSVLVSQIEVLINRGREAIGNKNVFRYVDFFEQKVLVNGLPGFVGELPRNSRSVGLTLGMTLPPVLEPNTGVAFISLGTGTGLNKITVLEKLLNIARERFQKIYVSLGNATGSEQVNLPGHAVARELFHVVPADTGCVICHGGYGTVHLGIVLGLPVFVLPLQIEHYSNGRRLEQIGGGHQFGCFADGYFMGLQQPISLDWNRLILGLENLPATNGRPLHPFLESGVDLLLVVDEELAGLKGREF